MPDRPDAPGASDAITLAGEAAELLLVNGQTTAAVERLGRASGLPLMMAVLWGEVIPRSRDDATTHVRIVGLGAVPLVLFDGGAAVSPTALVGLVRDAATASVALLAMAAGLIAPKVLLELRTTPRGL